MDAENNVCLKIIKKKLEKSERTEKWKEESCSRRNGTILA